MEKKYDYDDLHKAVKNVEKMVTKKFLDAAHNNNATVSFDELHVLMNAMGLLEILVFEFNLVNQSIKEDKVVYDLEGYVDIQKKYADIHSKSLIKHVKKLK